MNPIKSNWVNISLVFIFFFFVFIITVEYFVGFLPSSQDSKHRLAFAQLKLLNTILYSSFDIQRNIFPKNWSDVRLKNPIVDETDLRDPFSLDGSQFLESFSENRIIIWTVGPNGRNDLSIQSQMINGKDEIVLIIETNGFNISSNLYDYGSESGETSFKNPGPISFERG